VDDCVATSSPISGLHEPHSDVSRTGGPSALRSRPSFKDLAGGGGLAFLIASATVGLSNFVFHIVVSRLLGPTQYGALGALLTVVLVLTVPITAVQTAVTRVVALRRDEPLLLRPMLFRSGLYGLAGFCMIAGLSTTLAGFLHLGSPVPVLALALWVPIAVVSAALQGVLVGRLRFTPFAVALLVGGGAARLLFGVVFVEMGLGVTGAMLASVFAGLVTLGIVAWPLRREFRPSRRPAERLLAMGDGLAALLALGGLSVFAGVDTFFVRHLLAPHQAGLYAAAATGSRIALFAPGAYVTLVFPRFAANHGRGPGAKRLLLQSMVVVALIGFLVAGTIAAMPHLLVTIMFGAHYSGSAGAIGILAVEASIIGLLGLLVYFNLARGSLAAQLTWVGVCLAVGGMALFHQSIEEVAMVMLITSLIVLVPSVLAVFLSDGSEHRSIDSPDEVDESEPDACGLSIVVPFFNPGPRFGPHLGDVVDVLTTTGITFEVIAVSDGSNDESEKVAADPLLRNVRLITMPTNNGKGAALRIGITEARGTYVGFIDADGDVPAGLIPRLVELTRGDDPPDVVLASKRHRDSKVVYPPLRHLYSMAYQALIAVLFHLPVKDTQTGLKLIRRKTLVAVLPRMVEKRFAFDLELLVVARHLGFRRFVEAPVVIGKRFTSTVSLQTVGDMLLDTLGIFYRLRILRFYDQVPEDVATTDPTPVDDGGPPEAEPATASPARRPITQSPLWGGLPSDAAVDGDSPLRILIYNWRDLRHPHAGGAEVYTDAVASAWVRSGHDVTLFTSAVEGCPERETAPGGYRVVRRGSWRAVYRSARWYWEDEGRGQFDLVIDEVNTRPFGCPRWDTGVPVVALIHQVAREVWFHETWLPLAILGRYWLEPHWLSAYRDTPTVTVSSSSRDSLEACGLHNVRVVAEGFSPRLGDVPSSPIPKEPTFTLAFAGRLAGNKRPDHAIKAFGLVHDQRPEARLWVMGTGPLEQHLRRHAPAGVEFLGHVTDDEKRDRLARAHALLLTSVREGWGLVVTEAAEAGTPSVGYDVPGLRDSITASGGVLVDRHPKAMAASLLANADSLMAASHPTVATGVITWPAVAANILEVAAASSRASSAVGSAPGSSPSVLTKDRSGAVRYDRPGSRKAPL
jgi:glycosyltransferase involved in cell wall biosynthesis/O-antigen/teichoic acid export membrane protein